MNITKYKIEKWNIHLNIFSIILEKKTNMGQILPKNKIKKEISPSVVDHVKLDFFENPDHFEEVTEDFIIAYDKMIQSQVEYFILQNKKFVSIGRFRGAAPRILEKKGKGLVNVEMYMFDYKYITLSADDEECVKFYKIKPIKT